MGICQSQEEKTLAQKSKAIDKEMMQGHIAQQKVVKLLLLGNYFDSILILFLYHNSFNYI